MKTELNSALVATLAKAMNTSLAIIDREENKLYVTLQKAWHGFLESVDGGADHWSYFNEDGSVKRKAVIEFRDAALAAGEQGGYSRTYISDLLRHHVSDDFVLRASAPRPRASKKDVSTEKEKFSKEQLENVTRLCLTKGLTKKDVKEILAALLA